MRMCTFWNLLLIYKLKQITKLLHKVYRKKLTKTLVNYEKNFLSEKVHILRIKI